MFFFDYSPMLDFNCLQNSVVKIGPFGSTSEAEGNRDITVAPLRLHLIRIAMACSTTKANGVATQRRLHHFGHL